MSYDRMKAATLVNSELLAHLNLSGPEFVHSISDSDDKSNLHNIPLSDMLKSIKIHRADGIPVNKLAQNSVNVFTFHFLRNVLYL